MHCLTDALTCLDARCPVCFGTVDRAQLIAEAAEAAREPLADAVIAWLVPWRQRRDARAPVGADASTHSSATTGRASRAAA